MEKHKIEVVRLHRIENGGGIKAFVDISIDNIFIIKAFRLVEGKEGLFVALPCEIGKNGKWFHNVEILSPDIKHDIEEAIIEAYGETVTV